MKDETRNFLIFLHNNNLVNLKNIQDDNVNGFQARVRLQKLLFLAQARFSLPENYTYSPYKHGPYSPMLASDSYDLDLDSVDEIQEEMHRFRNSYNLPPEFDQDKFVSLFVDKNNDWLVIASSLIEYKDNSADANRNTLIETVNRHKPNYEKEYIENVFDQLSREKLILTVMEEMEKIVNKNPDIFRALAKEDISLIK